MEKSEQGIEIDKSWKIRNKEYLFELQKMLDVTENIKDEELRTRVINQCLKLDDVLTEISEKLFNEYYNKGRNKE